LKRLRSNKGKRCRRYDQGTSSIHQVEFHHPTLVILHSIRDSNKRLVAKVSAGSLLHPRHHHSPPLSRAGVSSSSTIPPPLTFPSYPPAYPTFLPYPTLPYPVTIYDFAYPLTDGDLSVVRRGRRRRATVHEAKGRYGESNVVPEILAILQNPG
jgi:hypothetical protein